ncbi:hypothetical protein [Roseateles sp. P5_E7]
MAQQSRPAKTAAINAAFRKVTGGDSKPRVDADDLARVNRLVLPVVLVALAAAAWVGWRADSVGPVLLWVFASLAAGSAMGFLFGIPKSGLPSRADPPSGGAPKTAAAAQTPRARPNTNLEEVSDWVTKIIVGLTLVHLEKLQVEIGRICRNAAAAIRPQPTASDISAATALVVGFALIGFLAMYLYMRLFVQGAIARSDGNLSSYLEAVKEAERIGAKDTSPASDIGPDEAAPLPVVPSAASLSAAQAVADAAPADPELVLQPLRQLAGEYELLRGQQEYSKERTQQMADIVRRMRPHAIAAAPYIGELIRSASTGEHLAATVILQMKYMPEHLAWLARRLVEERAFIGYQAASALLTRVRVAGQPECKAIQAAVSAAQADRQQAEISEPSLDHLIDQIVATR